MAANGDATMTIDTNEWKYPMKDGMTVKTVTNAQTLVFELTAGATAGSSSYKMKDGKTITTTDGGVVDNLTIEADPAFTWFHVEADATEEENAGAMRIWETSDSYTDWNVSSCTIDNVDEPTAFTATFTPKDGSNRSFTLTTVTVAQ